MHGCSPVCDGRTGHAPPPHCPHTLLFLSIRLLFRRNGDNRAPLAYPPRAGATNTLPSQSNHLAATSSPPRAAIVHRRSPVSRLQLAKSVSAATVCEDEEGAAAVVHLSPPGLLPCTETNSKSTGSRTRNMSNAQPLPVPSQRIVSAPTARYYKTCHAHPFPSHRIHLSLSSASFVCSKHEQSHAPSSLHCQWPVPS